MVRVGGGYMTIAEFMQTHEEKEIKKLKTEMKKQDITLKILI